MAQFDGFTEFAINHAMMMIVRGLLLVISAHGFLPSFTSSRTRGQRTLEKKDSWGTGDDWSKLSREENRPPEVYMDQDFAQIAAYKMQDLSWIQEEYSPEESWMKDALDSVLNDEDSETDDIVVDHTEVDPQDFLDDMGREIALLVRCNQSPEEMLIAAGKALPPLSKEDKNEVLQLLEWKDNKFQPTPFLKTSVRKLFNEHATMIESKKIMNRKSVAAWMVKSLAGEPCGPHDPRVSHVVSQFGDYGAGYLNQKNLMNLYMSTLVGSSKTPEQLRFRIKERDLVFRDLRNHGVLSPVEVERERLLQEIRKKYDSYQSTSDETLMDECEVEYDEISSWKEDDDGAWKRTGKSSHQLIQLASDNSTPLHLKDGDYIFIDEDSCIGCMQCVNAAPTSFAMMSDGRARTVRQRKAPDVDAAVSACPVTCMHRVGFDRLKRLEKVREYGDGRTDHRHFGKNQRTGGWIPKTPLQ